MRRYAVLLCAVMVLNAAPPTPEAHFGFRLGTDRKLADWKELTSFFEQLGKTSDRVKFADLGKTTEGRPFVMLTISSPANLAKLERYRTIQERLSDPRG